MNNNSNTNEIISEVSSAGQTFVSGKVEDGELHVTLKQVQAVHGYSG